MTATAPPGELPLDDAESAKMHGRMFMKYGMQER